MCSEARKALKMPIKLWWYQNWSMFNLLCPRILLSLSRVGLIPFCLYHPLSWNTEVIIKHGAFAHYQSPERKPWRCSFGIEYHRGWVYSNPKLLGFQEDEVFDISSLQLDVGILLHKEGFHDFIWWVFTLLHKVMRLSLLGFHDSHCYTLLLSAMQWSWYLFLFFFGSV